MSEKQSLIVPIQLHAMCVGVNESAQKGSYFSPPTAQYNRSMDALVKGEYINGPFKTDTGTSKDLQGIHLHWFLPDALTQVLETKENEADAPADFPIVPNRWLVTRLYIKNMTETDPPCASRSWVVESDFLSTDSQYQNSATIPQLNDAKPFRYMGRLIPLEKWQGEDAQAERFPGLSAIGHGDPSFSLFYPNCRNVFGMHDSLEDLSDYSPTLSQLSYSVIGWYTDKRDDPLAQAHDAGEIIQRLEYFNWLVEKDSAIEQINQTLCCGMVRDIKWNPQEEYISRELEKSKALTVAIGNRVSDGLSALLAGMSGTDKHVQREKLLDAFQAGHLDRLDRVDAMAELDKSLHKNTFTSESGGILWSIKEKDPGKKEAVEALSPDVVTQLDALNSRQSQFNRILFELQSNKQQASLDWNKYMYFKYDSDTQEGLKKAGIDDSLFQEFLKPDMDLDHKLNSLYTDIQEHVKTLNASIGDEYMLNQDRVAARFFRPNDPVILLTGEAMRPTLQHAPDQKLPCLLQQQLLSPSNSSFSLQMDDLPDYTDQLLNGLFFPDSTPMKAMDDETSAWESFFKQLALKPWRRPWNPIFMHWSIEYQPLMKMGDGEIGDGKKSKRFPADLISSRFALSEHSIDLSEQESSTANYESYEGITILTPHAVASFAQLAQSYVQQNNNDDIANALQALQETPVLSQALSGFHDALIMRSGEMLLPVDDPDAEASVKALHQSIKTYVGEIEQYVTTPHKAFNPVRAGWMKIGKIRIVDTFGQYRDIQPQQVYASQSLNLKNAEKPEIFLAPRLIQPGRLQLTWMPADKQFKQTNEHPATTPICGWIVPNFMGQSLMIYDSAGTPLGEIRSWENQGVIFQSSPASSHEFSIRSADNADFSKQMMEAIPENATLRDYVASMLERDAEYMNKFMQIFDEGLSDVEPEEAQDSNLRALLTGRPVAIVRIALKLDLKGLPVVNQSWNSVIDDILRPGSKASRDCADFTQIKFPIRFGNAKQSNEYNDGLIGYYRQAKGEKAYDFNAFYSYQADGSNDYMLNPADSSIELTADQSPTTLLVLMDPRGGLNVTSGILPKKSIEIPTSHYQDFYNSMEVSFLTSPVLHPMYLCIEKDEDGIDLPLSAEGDHDWLWIEKDNTGWRKQKVLFKQSEAISPSPLMINEGWLRLVKKEVSTDD